MSAAEILVVGATGMLGMEVVRRLKCAGKAVRAVVRTGAPEDKRTAIENLGVASVAADLKDVATLELACRGVRCVVSTASAMLSRAEGDSLESVDEQGQLDLILAAERQGVERFVFVSFPPSNLDFGLQHAKRRIEERLRGGRLAYTVLQPTFFAEVWLSPAVGFDPVGGKVRIFGDGRGPVSWVSIRDVARFAAAATEGPAFSHKVIPLGGPDPLSPLQVLRIFEELGGPVCTPEFVPEAALMAQLAGATNPFEEGFAALMLTVSRGVALDARQAVQLLPGQLVTVRDYASRLLGKRSDTRFAVKGEAE